MKRYVALLLCVLFALSGTSIAQDREPGVVFHSKWGGNAYISDLASDNSSIMTNEAKAFVDFMATFFDLQTQQAADDAANVDKTICQAIELAKMDNEAIGNWLEMEKDNIKKECMEGGIFGYIIDDCEETCSSNDVMHLNLKKIPTDCPPIYDPDFIELVNTLLHEGLHALQSWKPEDETTDPDGTGNPDDPDNTPGNTGDPDVIDPDQDGEEPVPVDPDKEKAERNKVVAENEVAAYQADKDKAEELKEALCNLQDGDPWTATGSNRAIIEAIIAIEDDAERQMAIDAAKAGAMETITNSCAGVECYGEYKAAYCAFIESECTDADKQALEDAINAIKWDYDDSFEDISVASTGKSGTIQVISNEMTTLETGLAGISELIYLERQNALVVSGMHRDGSGSVLAFTDTNGNGSVLDETPITLIAGLAMNNLDLTYNETNGSFYLFDGIEHQLWSLAVVDGLPVGLDRVVWQHDGSMLEVPRTWTFDVDGKTLMGSEIVDPLGRAMDWETEITQIDDLDGDGYFETTLHGTYADTVTFTDPNFLFDPRPGQKRAKVVGTLGNSIKVVVVDENLEVIEVLGSTVALKHEGTYLYFSRPVIAGERVRVVDTELEIATHPIEIRSPRRQ